MTSSNFQIHFPKPWHFRVCETTFGLYAANGKRIGGLSLASGHSGVPQREWNRQVAAALREYLSVLDSDAPKPNVVAD